MGRVFNLLCILVFVSCSSDDEKKEVKPLAVDDEVYSFRSETTTWNNLTANDQFAERATITTIFTVNTKGEVKLNGDGSVSYTPMAGYTGEDSFTYELCELENSSSCSGATVFINVIESLSLNIPAELQSYYSDLRLSTNTSYNRNRLIEQVKNKHHIILNYGQRHNYLYDADEDPDNPENVILIYTGESRYWREYQSGNNPHSPQTFNTEHVYPQSLLTVADAVTDLHHLRVADVQVNSERSNFPFTEGSGGNQLINSNSWYPGDEWRGDVARMIMYLNLRYNENFSKVGNLDLFLKWNRLDPVSFIELQRNQVIQGAQGNRNPFVDNPYLATLIWGGIAAENLWE